MTTRTVVSWRALGRSGSAAPAVVFVLLAGLLAGCTVLERAEGPPTHTYRWAASVETPVDEDGGGPVLVVAEPDAEPGYDTDRIAYVDRPYALRYYAYNQWADTPAHMLAPLLTRALEATGAFRAVVPADTAAFGHVRLESEIVRAHQDFTERPSQVKIAIDVRLIGTPRRQLIAARRFETSEPAPSEDAYGGVQAMNRALGALLPRIAAFCAQQTRTATADPGAKVSEPTPPPDGR